MHGIINLNKPQAKSSHAMVYSVRRILNISRVGHGGTLDPMATGVLLICVGQAVRITEYLIEHDKKYHARVRFGVTTDTYDATGTILDERAVSLTRGEIENALDAFVGKISQHPPAFSAIKREGIALYRLARRGIEVETKARPVEIYSIQLNAVLLPDIELTVHCSKGTYIRSLAHDVGEKLGCGAHLAGLHRLASGDFRIEDAVTLEQLRSSADERDLERHLIPLDRALEHLDSIDVDAATARKVANGLSFASDGEIATPLARVYASGRLIALAEQNGQTKSWRPKKVFVN